MPVGTQPALVLLHMEGCSGSTFLSAMAEDMLACTAGWRAFTDSEQRCRGEEYLKRTCNSWLSQLQRVRRNTLTAKEWRAALLKMDAVARQQNATLLINSDLRSGSGPTMQALLPTVLELRVPLAHVARENVLDRFVCAVRDCFPTRSPGSYAVCSGKRSELCFQRRSAPLQSCPLHQAHLNASDVASHLGMMERMRLADHKWLVDRGLTTAARPISSERLLAVQYSDDEVAASGVSEWLELLRTFGVAGATHATVDACARRYRASRAPPSVQSGTIHNDAEVRLALCGEPLRRHLRPPCSQLA